MSDDATASAAEQLAQSLVGADEAAPEEPSGEEAAAEEVQQEAAAEEFDLEPAVPEDIREFLDEPDFEAEAEAEIEAEEPTEDYTNDEDYVDPNLAAERKRRVAAEKRLAWLEEQRVKESVGKWKSEADKYFPLSKTTEIKANSRRAYLRKAEEAHKAALPLFKELVKQFEAEVAQKQNEVTEAKRETEMNQWGPAVAGGSAGVPPEAAELQRKRANYDMAKSRGNLVDMIKNSDYFRIVGGS